MSGERPNREQLLHMAAAFMPGCVLGAAAELDLFTLIGTRRMPLETVARKLKSDLRATRILLDALVALQLLEKHAEGYAVPEAIRPLLCANSSQCILPMVRHRMNILRGWSQLAWVVKAGIPAPRPSSIRGPSADTADFINAMHVVAEEVADRLVEQLGPLEFRHFLDVGGASGTWTVAFLRAVPDATATLFDLSHAIAEAHRRLASSDLAARIRLVAGDYFRDPLPTGADFAWVSAIVHQNSREQNRELFRKVHAALQPGGRIAVRDVVMEPDRTQPQAGALFAVNMLANTQAGDTFTFEELAEDLKSAGFLHAELVLKSDGMDSVVMAMKS